MYETLWGVNSSDTWHFSSTQNLMKLKSTLSITQLDPFKVFNFTLIYFEKVGLEEIEKCKIAIFQHQILNLETSLWKVVKNIWSTEAILLSKIVDCNGKFKS